MPDPSLQREGNARIASLPAAGLPPEPWDLHAQVLQALAQQEDVEAYGAAVILFDLPPEGDDPRGWRCQVGSALVGRARSVPPLLVEDYRQLNALSLPHMGPLADLATTHRTLQDHARAHGWMLRPYWRLSVERGATPDGNPLPEVQLSLFVDR